MTYLRQLLIELREKRLWPVAAVLVLALIAVPTLLAKSSPPTPLAQLPQSAPAAAATAVPAVSVETTPANSKLKGHARDPFLQQKLAAAAKPASTATSKPSPGPTGNSGSSAASGGSTPSSTSSTGGSPTVTPLPRVRFYRFATSLRFGRVGSRLRLIRDADKFTPLPSASNPVVLFLGLRNDARTAVFMLSSSASATGRGTCQPNQWSCNFLYLKVGQRELVLTQGVLGHVAQYELDLTRIHPVATSAPTGATASSKHVSSAGRRIFKRAAAFLPALRSIVYSTKTGLLRFTHRSPVRPVHVGRLARYPATAVRAVAGDGAM